MEFSTKYEQPAEQSENSCKQSSERSKIDYQKIELIFIKVLTALFIFSFLGLMLYGIDYYKEKTEKIDLSIAVSDKATEEFLAKGKNYYVLTGGKISHDLVFEDGVAFTKLEKLEGMQLFKILEKGTDGNETEICLYVDVEDNKIKSAELVNYYGIITIRYESNSLYIDVLSY